jgi:integrase
MSTQQLTASKYRKTSPHHPAETRSPVQLFPKALRERLIATTAQRFKDGLASSSRTTYDVRTQAYITFCTQMGWEPAFPLNTTHLATYYEYYVNIRGLSVTSLPGILSCLNHAQQTLGYPKITPANEFYLTQVIKGIKRTNPTQGRRPKFPITLSVIQQLATRLSRPHEGPPHPTGWTLQILCMCLTGHDGLLRTGELLRLHWEDVTFTEDDPTTTIPSTEDTLAQQAKPLLPAGAPTRPRLRDVHLNIIQSKCNKFGPPEIVHIPMYGDGTFCAATYLRRYILTRRLEGPAPRPKDPLFPSLKRYIKATTLGISQTRSNRRIRSKPMTKDELRRTLNTYLPEAQQTTHSGLSFRAGGATDLYESHQCAEETIKRQGRWKSDAFRLYIRAHPKAVMSEIRNAFASMGYDA